MDRATGGSRDPDRVALRHAARVGVVGVAVFVGLGWVIDRPEAAGPALFAVYTLGAQAHFAGPPSRRALRYLVTGTVALAMFPIVAAIDEVGVLVVAATGVVVFAAVFLGTLGGPFYAARFPVVIAFLFAATTAFTGDLLRERMLGWAVGTVAITAGALVLWPVRSRTPVPALAADVCRRAAAAMRPGSGDPAGLLDASHRLRVAANREHLRPGAVASDERRWSELVHATERLAAGVATLTPPAPAPEDTALLEQAADALAAAADTIETGAPRADRLAEPLEAALDRHARLLAARVAAATTPPAAEAAVRAGGPATDSRIIARTSLEVTALADALATGAPPTGPTVADAVDDRPEAALRAQLRLRSLWFRNALRAAVALMAAVALVREGAGDDHGFWVALGAFSVLRADLGTTTRSARTVVVGTAIGFASSSVVVLVADSFHPLLWITFPIALFLAVYAERLPGEVGAAAFTVLLVTMYTLTEPAGLRTGELRFVNVSSGAAVTLAVGALLWPRAGRAPGEVVAGVVERARRALATALGSRSPGSARALVAELDRLLDMISSSAPGAFSDRTRARVLTTVDITVTMADYVAQPAATVPVPLTAALGAPRFREAIAVDLPRVDGALRSFAARLAHAPSPPIPPRPERLAEMVAAALASGASPPPDVASAGIRLSAALARVYDLATAAQPTDTGTLA